jgi:hypothetical protein
MRTSRVRLQGPAKRILALAAAWSLFSLPSLAVACAISCDSASCEPASPACAAHEQSGSEPHQVPPSSSHCPDFHSAGAVISLPRPLSIAHSGSWMPAHELLVPSSWPFGPAAPFSSECPTPRSRSALLPLRI